MKKKFMREYGWGILIGLAMAGLVWVLWRGLAPVNAAQMNFTKEEVAFPAFTLADARDPRKEISLKNLKGEPHLVHVWATWCGVCVDEHDNLVKLKKKWPNVNFVGVVYRDDVKKVRKLFKRKGDPYTYVINDIGGTLGLELGLYGTPETFLLDANGVIRYHQIGAITTSEFEETIIPLIKNLNSQHGINA